MPTIKRSPPRDLIDMIDEAANTLREQLVLLVRAECESADGIHVKDLEGLADKFADTARMALANLVLATNPLERKRAKKKAR